MVHSFYQAKLVQIVRLLLPFQYPKFKRLFSFLGKYCLLSRCKRRGYFWLIKGKFLEMTPA